MTLELYTIGHSTHPIEKFIELLTQHSITAVCDVRSHPYSKFNPQFNRESLQKELREHGIVYVFLGEELGARSSDPNCYINGKVHYPSLAQSDLFHQGLSRLRKGMESYRVALMCAEKDPITCHRTILICRHLRADNIDIQHILEDGSIEKNSDSEERLLQVLKLPQGDLFTSVQEYIERAYDLQGEKIAYSAHRDGSNSGIDTEEENE